MIDKRLLSIVPDVKKYIAGNVLLQWGSLIANIIMMTCITSFIARLYYGTATTKIMIYSLICLLAGVIIRYICATDATKMSYLSSKEVKKTLRAKIFKKLVRLGPDYNKQVNTAEVIQVAVEGVDQLETYFGQYLPQFFYAMLAPVTLFVYLCFVNVPSAIVLLVCVPLIPVSIAAVQTWAKKLLSKYWDQYTKLGDTFLENLQGLTTLKIYQSDKYKHDEMNAESEKFRKITMKVLTMQLNSVTIMDFIAYGGAALGLIISICQFKNGNVDLAGCLLIILLAADFFIPMRQLGSYFHVAMNGMAASDKIFKLLDLEEKDVKKKKCPDDSITIKDLHFSYTEDREILKGIDTVIEKGKMTAVVGESGCGKSTLVSILCGKNQSYTGEILFGSVPLSQINEVDLLRNVTCVGYQSYIFKGTVRENLQMGKIDATDEEMWSALEKTRISEFLVSEQGLDTPLTENGSNLSGGQRQRIALARALLRDSAVYIFDEATSNIDVESENDIMDVIKSLRVSKTVIVISHRLKNVMDADNILVLEGGRLVQSGTHAQLLQEDGAYASLYNAQRELENFAGGEAV